MLSPDPEDTLEELAEVATRWARLNAFTGALLGASIQELDPEPPWLVSAREALSKNRGAGERWFEASPEVVSALVSPYIAFAATFKAFSELAPVGSNTQENRDTLLELLGGLRGEIQTALESIDAGNRKLDGVVALFGEDHGAMVAAVGVATAAHEQEHEAIAEASAKIAALEEKISGLSEAIGAADLAAGKTFLETEVDLIFEIVAGEIAIPFIGIGLALLSIGTDLVEVILKSGEIDEALNELHDVLIEQAEDIQAVSAIHTVLQVLNRLNEQYVLAAERGPHIKVLWTTFDQRLGDMQEALQAGADPTLMIDLQSLPKAAKVWEYLARAAKHLLQLKPASKSTVTLRPHPKAAAL